ncbi:sentrin-specific protease-like [Drosophila willistoni]|uniref:sentrin-specific protease-like n=1 Tax=Drosophila willistoni TaxID=7260 RepID=UPI001F07B424|nr:sentrin-specific protease-like [Drosophila willistoni]
MIDKPNKSFENPQTMKPNQISRKRKCNETDSFHVTKYRILSTNDCLAMSSSDGYLSRSTHEFQRPVPGTGAEINLLSSQERIRSSSRPTNLCFFDPKFKECNNLHDSLSNLVYVSSSSNCRILQRTKALMNKFKNNIYLVDNFTDTYNQKVIRSRQERELLLKSTEFELEAIKEERLAYEKQMALKLVNENLGLDRRISKPTMNDKATQENVDQEIISVSKLIMPTDQYVLACENASNDIQMEEATQDLNKHIKLQEDELVENLDHSVNASNDIPIKEATQDLSKQIKLQEDELVKAIENPDQSVSDYIKIEQTEDLQFIVNESPQELVYVSDNIELVKAIENPDESVSDYIQIDQTEALQFLVNESPQELVFVSDNIELVKAIENPDQSVSDYIQIDQTEALQFLVNESPKELFFVSDNIELVKAIENPDQSVSDYIQMDQTEDLQFIVNESPQELVYVSDNIELVKAIENPDQSVSDYIQMDQTEDLQFQIKESPQELLFVSDNIELVKAIENPDQSVSDYIQIDQTEALQFLVNESPQELVFVSDNIELVKAIESPDQSVSDYIQMDQTQALQFLVNESPKELVIVSDNIQIKEENNKQTNSPKKESQSSDKELINSVNKIDQSISHDNQKEEIKNLQFSSTWLRYKNKFKNTRNSQQFEVHDIQNDKKEKEPKQEKNKDQNCPTNSQIDIKSDQSMNDVLKNIIKSIDFSTIKSPNNANSVECVEEEVKNEEKEEKPLVIEVKDSFVLNLKKFRNRRANFIKEASPLIDRFGSRNEYFTLTETHLKWLNMSIKNKNDEFPLLTTEMMHRYNNLMEGHPDDEIISKFSLHIKRVSIRTLSGSNWLDDQIVNFYMNLISERSEMKRKELPITHCMSTFFIPIFVSNGYAAVRRWTTKVDIFSKDIIVVPVHTDTSHWCVAIIHMRQRTLRSYDSLGQFRTEVLDALKLYLKQESLDKHRKLFNTNTLLIENAMDAPKQRNSNDCGVFSCMVPEYITRDQPLTFTQRHIPYLRVKMALEISEGRLWL